jgi:hypothetical protein
MSNMVITLEIEGGNPHPSPVGAGLPAMTAAHSTWV